MSLTIGQVNTIMDKAYMLEDIDSADLKGYYNKSNLLSKIYSAKYIDNNTGLAKWLELRYKERYGDV